MTDDASVVVKGLVKSYGAIKALSAVDSPLPRIRARALGLERRRRYAPDHRGAETADA
jgi:hypothetical protein